MNIYWLGAIIWFAIGLIGAALVSEKMRVMTAEHFIQCVLAGPFSVFDGLTRAPECKSCGKFPIARGDALCPKCGEESSRRLARKIAELDDDDDDDDDIY